MSKIHIQTTQNVAVEYEIASAGDRMMGYLIDMFVIVAYIVSVSLLFTETLGNVPMYIWVIVYLPVLFYDLLFEVFFNGQSLGKRQMKIKVVALNGGEATLGSYLIRWILRPIDFSLFGPFVALVTVAASGKGQRIGDLAAGTSVVYVAEKRKRFTPRMPDMETEYIPTFPSVITLSSRDIAIVEQVMASYGKGDNNDALYIMQEKVKQTLEVESDLPPMTFLRTIVKDYHHYMTTGH
ncbi:RDD family protein [Rapidithrix thailandica]|uniref:RDD family protein n=1 Tax=Rapidithrix thailandica TaxID=413964 RepID=A0AAW9S2D7_9BACT